MALLNSPNWSFWLFICLFFDCVPCRFHPPCVNLTTEQVKKMDHFFCSDCIKEDDMKLRNSGKDSPPLEQKV
jgi:hypothetical protein